MGGIASTIKKRGVQGFAGAAVESLAEGTFPSMGKLAVGTAKNIILPAPVGQGENQSAKATMLMEKTYDTSSKLEAVCAVFSSSIYYAGSNTVVMQEANSHKATAFYLSVEDVDRKAIFAYIPDGRKVELLSMLDEFEQGGPGTPINVRFNNLSGFVRKLHCKEPCKGARIDDYKEELQAAIAAHPVPLGVSLEYASIKRECSLLNTIATAVVKIDGVSNLIIAWSGTDLAKRPMDLLTDVSAAPAACPLWHSAAPWIHAHSSMVAQTQGNFLTHKVRIQALLAEYKCQNLVFTGHSLGGGCALLAHMCTLGQAFEGALSEKLTDVAVYSIVFAAPMVFYKKAHTVDDCQALGMEPDVVDQNEAAIRAVFKETSVNHVCAMDIVPRLPGHPDFYRPAIRETISSLGTSTLMNNLPVDAATLQTMGKATTEKLLDLFLDKRTLSNTWRDLKWFQHLSTVRYLKHVNNELLHTDIGSDDIKEEPWQAVDEVQAFQYYLNCHSWFPSNVRYTAD